MNGTDGYIFPPLRPKEMPVQVYERTICRTVFIPYKKRSSVRGVPANLYLFDFGDIQNEPENRCFCRDEDQCPLKGTMDLFHCIGTPITVSFPHFYNADPSLLEKIGEGLNPDKKKHETYIHMERVGNYL